MKIRYTLELDDESRKALAHHFGMLGRISREHSLLWLESLVNSTLQEIQHEYEEDRLATHLTRSMERYL